MKQNRRHTAREFWAKTSRCLKSFFKSLSETGVHNLSKERKKFVRDENRHQIEGTNTTDIARRLKMNRIYEKEVLVLIEQLRTARRQIRLLRRIALDEQTRTALIKALDITAEEFELFKV
mgnify:CR=1 FL=1